MQIYKYELTPSKPHSTINYCEKGVRATLLKAPQSINDGYAFRRDGKALRIEAENVGPQRIVVTLESKASLPHATRSLSALTRYLSTRHADIWAGEIYNRTIFRMTLLSADSDNAPEDLSDAELSAGLIKLLFSDNAVDPALRKTIVEVKRLLLPFLKQ